MKKRIKVWKDIDKVIKASEIPKEVQYLVEIMEEVPNGEKSSN